MELIADQQQKSALKMRAAELFSPRTPVDTKELFAGRYEQILKIQSTIAQNGAHAIVYGERGAGKTSLANIAPIAYSVEFDVPLESIVSPKVNCDGTDTFDLLWRKVFRKIDVVDEFTPIGFLATQEVESCNLLDILDDEGDITPDRVVRVLKSLSKKSKIIITLDEFDRLPGGEAPRLIADTIKALSDNNIQATVVVVGGWRLGRCISSRA
jgi:Cdc6-like AAA superfamily ATPase